MIPQRSNFSYVAGDTIRLLITVTDASNLAVNLTGYTAKFAVRTLAGTLTLSSPTTASITITDAAGGILTVIITAANTLALSGNYRYEAEITDGSGIVQTIARGLLEMLGSIAP